MLIFAQSELEYLFKRNNFSNFTSSVLAGMGGGLAQAYTTMGFCTFMKTVEVTRSKSVGTPESTLSVAYKIFQKEGIVGINKGLS